MLVWFLSRSKEFSLLQNIQTFSEAQTSSCSIGAAFLEVKRDGCETGHSFPSSFEVKNSWSRTSTLSCVYMAWLGWRKGRFYLSSIKYLATLFIYLFIYCLLVYNGSSSGLTYNPLVSNGGWLMNGALIRMWRKRSQPLWDITTISWKKEVTARKVLVKTANFQAKIWIRNCRMWGLKRSIPAFGHGTLVGLGNNYWFCHLQEGLFRNWQVMCQSKLHIKLWLRRVIKIYISVTITRAYKR